MKQIFLTPLLCLILSNAFCQEMLGMVSSNYSGNVGLTLNPASVVGMPFKHEFNLHSENLSVQNNYLYFPAGSNNLSNIFNGKAISQEKAGLFYNSADDKQMFVNAFIMGPSYCASKHNSGWAIHTAVRMNVNIEHMNNPIAKFLWNGFDLDPQNDIQFKTDPYAFNMLQWYEAGFTYGRKLVETKRALLTLGATFNLNLGSNAIYINSQPMTLSLPSYDTLQVNNFTGTYAHTIANDHPDINDFTGVKGIGGGLNLGVQYYLLRKDKTDDPMVRNNRKYIFKLGASLVDLGYVKFFKDNHVDEFNNNTAVWTIQDTVKIRGINNLEEYLNTKFTGSPEGALTNKKIKMGLPTAASIQLDFNLYKNFFTNITWLQGLSLNEPQVKHASQISITPSYQSSHFEIAFPYSIYQYSKKRFGVCLRYRFFFIGTDEIGAYTGKYNVDGLNAYFGLKFVSRDLSKTNTKKNMD